MNLKFVGKSMCFYFLMFSVSMVFGVLTNYVFTSNLKMSIVNSVAVSCLMTPLFFILVLRMNHTSVIKFI